MPETNRPSGGFKDKAQETASTASQGVRQTASTAGQAASEVKHRAQEAGSAAKQNIQEGMHRAGDTASDLAHRASDAVSSAASSAADVASRVGDRAQEAVSNVGERMHSLGSAVRDRGPRGGLLGSATSAVASGLETGGDYLQEQRLSGMLDDVKSLVRRFPIQSLLVGVGLGLLMSRALHRE